MGVNTRAGAYTEKISEIMPGQKNNREEDMDDDDDDLVPVKSEPSVKSEPRDSPVRPYVDGSPVSYVDCKVGLVL